MSSIRPTDRSSTRTSELFKERNEILRWTLDGKPPRTDLFRLITGGIGELPPLERRECIHELFLEMATAVTWLKGSKKLSELCYMKLTGQDKVLPTFSVANHPKIRRHLGLDPAPKIPWRRILFGD